MRKILIINSLGVFRVGVFTTLKTVEQLSLSNLQVALRPSIKGQRYGNKVAPERTYRPGLVFFIGTLSQPLTLSAFLFNPPDPLSKGAIRAYGLSIAAGLSLPASFGPASADALVALRSDFFALLCRCPKP